MADWLQSNYKGDKVEGLAHGKGIYSFPNGAIYEGEFSHGNFHGKGTITYPNQVRKILKSDEICRGMAKWEANLRRGYLR